MRAFPAGQCHAPRHRGFTLVEILVAMAVVVILASLVTPMIITAVKREKEHELRLSLRQLRQAIDDYKQAGDLGRIPRLPGETGYPKNLEILVLGVRDQLDPAGRRIYFLRRMPRDPFANDAIAAVDTWGKRAYGSDPDNPQPGSDVFDVYSLSPAIGLNGTAYRQW